MDLYPFGFLARNWNAGASRYGFNGKEQDSETGWEDYGMRTYNPSLGKFLSIDPITKDYPMLTPYQFASNSPIAGVDLDGLEFFYAADGQFIGKVGTSTSVMVINESIPFEQAKATVDNAVNNKTSSENFAKTAKTFSESLTWRGNDITHFEFE